MTQRRYHCDNDRCDNGWIAPTEAYVQHHAPMPADPGPDASHAVITEYEIVAARAEASQAAHRNDVYPCKTCRPEAFFRWAGRHYEAGHDPKSCEMCVDVHRARGPVDMAQLTSGVDTTVHDTEDDWTRSRADLR
jgi:hypothetical protein